MIKGVKFRKEVKLSPFADDILVCLKKFLINDKTNTSGKTIKVPDYNIKNQ